MKRLFTLWLLLCSGFCVQHTAAQLLALKTNALYDALMVPNLGMEVIVGEKTSLNASVFGAYKAWGKDIKAVGITPEIRYWFNGRPLTREFVGASIGMATYDIVWGGQRYKGDGYAAALTFGYVFVLSPHWSLECHSGIGVMGYDQQRYYIGDRVRDSHYNVKGFMVIPYNLGVTLSWILK